MGFFYCVAVSSDSTVGACWIRRPFPYECTREWKRYTEPVRFEKRTRGPTYYKKKFATPFYQSGKIKIKLELIYYFPGFNIVRMDQNKIRGKHFTQFLV